MLTRKLLDSSPQPVTLPLGNLKELQKQILFSLSEDARSSFKVARYFATLSKGPSVLVLKALLLRAR